MSEFEASLVYRVSSRTAKATERNPVSKNQTKPNKKLDQIPQGFEGLSHQLKGTHDSSGNCGRGMPC